MAYQHGEKTKAYVGTGGDTPLTGTIYGLTFSGGVLTYTRSSGDFTASAFRVGGLMHSSGFANAVNNHHSIIKTISALSMVAVVPVDDDGNPVTPITEAAGPTITLTPEQLNLVKGQIDTRYTLGGGTVDISNKDTGGFGASLAGLNQLQISVNGVVNWPDTTGYEKLRDHLIARTQPWCAIVLNEALDRIFGKFAVSESGGGGSSSSGGEYNFTLSNFIRPNVAKIV